MKEKFKVEYTEYVKRVVSCEVEAESECEAIKKVKDGDYDFSSESHLEEETTDTQNYRIL